MHHYSANEFTSTDLCGRCSVNSENYHNFICILSCLNYPVAMDATPSWNIIQCARVRAPNLEYVARIQCLHTILSANNWHRAQQVSGIQDMSCHMYHWSGISEDGSGWMHNDTGSPRPSTASNVTRFASRPWPKRAAIRAASAISDSLRSPSISVSGPLWLVIVR